MPHSLRAKLSGLRYKQIISSKDYDRLCKALDNEDALDKIRAEIMDTGAYEQEVHGKTEFLKGINYCLGVIDKYKTERSDKEWLKLKSMAKHIVLKL